jgi:hypothetical protein
MKNEVEVYLLREEMVVGWLREAEGSEVVD